MYLLSNTAYSFRTFLRISTSFSTAASSNSCRRKLLRRRTIPHSGQFADPRIKSTSTQFSHLVNQQKRHLTSSRNYNAGCTDDIRSRLECFPCKQWLSIHALFSTPGITTHLLTQILIVTKILGWAQHSLCSNYSHQTASDWSHKITQWVLINIWLPVDRIVMWDTLNTPAWNHAALL